MATLHELSTRTGISLKTLRKLEKLKIDFNDIDPPADDPAAPLRFHLMRNQSLTVAQLLQLLDTPALVDDLGKYADRARLQIANLGTIAPAPSDVTAEIRDAGKGDANAIAVLVDWLKAMLPERRAVQHHWISVRWLKGLNPTLRAQTAPMISLALMHVRQAESFAGWSQKVETAKGKKSIIYSRPSEIMLDL